MNIGVFCIWQKNNTPISILFWKAKGMKLGGLHFKSTNSILQLSNSHYYYNFKIHIDKIHTEHSL